MTNRKTATKKTAPKPKAKSPKAKTPAAVSPAVLAAVPAPLSALDAAALVLKDAAEPMSVGQVLAAMLERKLWSSPAGKTPSATLYSGIFREIEKKGDHARFAKAGRGLFVATANAAS